MQCTVNTEGNSVNLYWNKQCGMKEHLCNSAEYNIRELVEICPVGLRLSFCSLTGGSRGWRQCC